MSNAMQHIVDAYVRLKNHKGLEDLLLHRHSLLTELESRTSLVLSSAVDAINKEVAIIEAGLAHFDDDEKTAAAEATCQA
jgi:hypothetical protein